MDSFTCNALEFNKVLDFASRFCRSEAGRQAILGLRPFSDVASIMHMQKLYDEYCTWKSKGDFSLIDFPDLSLLLQKIRQADFYPESEDFWIFKHVLRLSRNAILSVQRHKNEVPTLAERCSFALADLSVSALQRCVADDGSFKDESSPGLMLARGELRSLHQSCLRRVKDYTEQYNIGHYLQDDYMTIVSDRYVLPLKANFKGRLQGIIHDYSRTGETLYFEPMFLVEVNNRLQELKQEEREEERKIIKLIIDLLQQEEASVEAMWDFLVFLDMTEAKSALSSAYLGDIAKGNSFARGVLGRCLAMEDNLNLQAVYHPLLLLENNRSERPKRIEAVDILFREQDKVLVISGGNAGGKTVALKTLGLISLMSLCALPVPAGAGSCMRMWKHIHAFIGDEQSLDDHVSTFTGQIKHLAEIWDDLDDGHLLLLDEFGAGTDPAQGAALAQAVLDGILEKNAYAMSATHFPALKTYALTKEGVRAASVLFDNRDKKPLYRLAYDQIGASLALNVAREHGLAESVLRQASHYLLLDSEDTEEMIDKLNALAVEREKSLDILAEEQEKTKQKRQDLQVRFEKEKARLELELREKSRELMNAWKQEKISAKQAMKEMAQIRAKIAVEEVESQKTVEPEQLKVGGEVLYRTWQKKGIIKEIDSKGGKVKIDMGGIAMWVATKDIELSNAPKSPEKTNVSTGVIHFSRQKPGLTLDLRGKRADLALSELTQFLDNTLLSGHEHVEIIHGRGTGALRKTVHQFLKTYPGIKSYSLATEEFGGDGATVVYFG